MNFLDYPAYVMGCLGIGDILCSFNALENVARERKRSIDVYVVHSEYFARVSVIFEALELQRVHLQLAELRTVVDRYGDGNYTVFQAFGMEVSWVTGWLQGWGLKRSIGHEHMVSFKRQPARLENAVGISFTVNSHPAKNIDRQSVSALVGALLDEGRDVYYFGFRKDTDAWLSRRFGKRLAIHDYDLASTLEMIGRCHRFIGADSGMAWIAAFHRVPTTILVGRGFGGLPHTFADLPWVHRRGEDDPPDSTASQVPPPRLRRHKGQARHDHQQ